MTTQRSKKGKKEGVFLQWKMEGGRKDNICWVCNLTLEQHHFKLTGFCPNSGHWSTSYRKCLESSVLAQCSYFLFLRYQHSILSHQSLWASVNMYTFLWQANRHVKQFHKWDLTPYSQHIWKSRQVFILHVAGAIWKTLFIYFHRFPDYYKEFLIQYLPLDKYIERYNNVDVLYIEFQIPYTAVQISQSVFGPWSSVLLLLLLYDSNNWNFS